MKRFLTDAYHAYRTVTKHRVYRIFRYGFLAVFSAYLLTIIFPQFLFAHEVSYKNFEVYSRQPLDENIRKILDSAEARLEKSPIYDREMAENIFISDSFALYTFLGPMSRKAFANTLPGVGNIRIGVIDAHRDLIFRNDSIDNQRSLSGVIAHEVTHNLIRKRFGLINSFTSLPNWKDEGYCEYVAGDTTLSFEEGVRRWKENPNDESRYAYFKYQQMVKYLLDDERMSVEELFTRNFDKKELEAKVYAKLCQN